MLLSFAYENSMPSHVLSASAVPHTCIRVASVPLLTDVHDRALTVARCGMRMMWARSPMRRTIPRWLRHLSGSAAGTCGADAGTDASEHVGCRVQTLMLGGPPLQLQLGGSIAGEELAVKFARWTPQRPAGSAPAPTIVICPSMSNNAFAASATDEDGTPVAGWWDAVVGHGSQYGIDLDRFDVLCAAPLGSPHGALSPPDAVLVLHVLGALRGVDDPAVNGTGETAWQLNRRAQFVIR